MLGKDKIQIAFAEDPKLIAIIDEIAAREGLKRADILRRATRIFLSNPTAGTDPRLQSQQSSQTH